MDFEEKIDAMRTTLELAILDIEAQRAGMQEMHGAVQEIRGAIQELRMLSAAQHENIQGLMKISGDLVKVVDSHSSGIGALEGRRSA
jgi:hypothetical protein